MDILVLGAFVVVLGVVITHLNQSISKLKRELGEREFLVIIQQDIIIRLSSHPTVKGMLESGEFGSVRLSGDMISVDTSYEDME